MKLLKRILLPINPEYYSKNCFDFVIKLAKLYQSEIIPIHVISGEADFKSVKEIALNLAKDHIKKVQTRIIKEGLKAGEPIIEYGNHYERIAVTALKYDINVIFFGIKELTSPGDIKLNLTIE